MPHRDPRGHEERSQAGPRLVTPRYNRPIRQYGIGLYWCPSESSDDLDYLVDLTDSDFPFGRCNCRHFECRIEPSRAVKSIAALACKHIARVQKETAIGTNPDGGEQQQP